MFVGNNKLIFLASGETLVVRAWHLRPSLIWKDGQWLEFSKVGENSTQKVHCFNFSRRPNCVLVCAKFCNFLYREIHHMKSDLSWVVAMQ